MTLTRIKKGDLLALDFDGVIADSIGECLVSGYNAFSEYSHRSRRITNLDEIGHLTSEAKRIRRYIRTGEDYVYIFMALHRSNAIESQEDFDVYKAANQSLIPCFHDLFYSHRRRFSREDPRAWAALNPLYPGMKSFLQDFSHIHDLFIVTSKQTDYAHLILGSNQIRLLPENAFQATGSLTKSDILARIIEERRVFAGQCHFIDDQVDTLLKVQPLGVRCYLAVWGYNDEMQAALGEANGIENLGLKDFLWRFADPS